MPVIQNHTVISLSDSIQPLLINVCEYTKMLIVLACKTVYTIRGDVRFTLCVLLLGGDLCACIDLVASLQYFAHVGKLFSDVVVVVRACQQCDVSMC